MYLQMYKQGTRWGIQTSKDYNRVGFRLALELKHLSYFETATIIMVVTLQRSEQCALLKMIYMYFEFYGNGNSHMLERITWKDILMGKRLSITPC